MNSIIFCEGRVDAALIGKYLEANKGWIYIKENKKGPVRLQKEDERQIIEKYQRDEHWIYIWGVGGRARFNSPLQSIMELNILDSTTAFDNIILVVDRDEEEESAIITEFADYIGSPELRCNDWIDISYKTKYEQTSLVRVMLLIIPFDEKGALETVMINSLAEQDDEKIIPQCFAFVDGIKSQKYLLKRREILKAKLSTIVSIIEPDRAVDSLVEIVKGIKWAKYNAVNRAFNKLLEL